MTLTKVNVLLSAALQADLEHGVKWLNEAASAKFAKDYPQLNSALATLFEAELREGDAMRDYETAEIIRDLEEVPPWDSLPGRIRHLNASIFQSDNGQMLHIYPDSGGYLAVETNKLMADLAPFSD